MNVQYDNSGRMKYHPELHFNHGKPWTTKDIEYLKEFYTKIGSEQCSLELGRTVGVVIDMVSHLRRTGQMERNTAKKLHKFKWYEGFK